MQKHDKPDCVQYALLHLKAVHEIPPRLRTFTDVRTCTSDAMRLNHILTAFIHEKIINPPLPIPNTDEQCA
jgi:hypothetical protein